MIRVNSQSGKGGIAYLMERHFGLVMPRRMQIEFSAVVQAHADASEAEVDIETLWTLFERTYLAPVTAGGAMAYVDHQATHRVDPHTQKAESGQPSSGVAVCLVLQPAGHLDTLTLYGTGPGLVDATVQALGQGLRVDHFEERAVTAGSQAKAWAVVEAAAPSAQGSRFGVGQHADIATAGVLAVLSAAARLGLAM